MKSFFAFIKKEWIELLRSGKLIILVGVFILLGIMNPLISKLTPALMEMMSEALEEAGMAVTSAESDALTSWMQFYKNMLIGFIVFICLMGGMFTREYRAGTLVIILTKGLERYKVVLAKWITMLMVWSICYWLCFGITYGLNACFWDKVGAPNLFASALYTWVFGVLVTCLMTLLSSVFDSSAGVLLSTGGVMLIAYLMSMLPKINEYSPIRLTEGAALIYEAAGPSAYTAAVMVAVVMSIASVALSIVIFNKKQI